MKTLASFCYPQQICWPVDKRLRCYSCPQRWSFREAPLRQTSSYVIVRMIFRSRRTMRRDLREGMGRANPHHENSPLRREKQYHNAFKFCRATYGFQDHLINYTLFYKKLGSTPSTKSFLISFLFSGPKINLLFGSRTLLGGYKR